MERNKGWDVHLIRPFCLLNYTKLRNNPVDQAGGRHIKHRIPHACVHTHAALAPKV